jgi:hypothetical protein
MRRRSRISGELHETRAQKTGAADNARSHNSPPCRRARACVLFIDFADFFPNFFSSERAPGVRKFS